MAKKASKQIEMPTKAPKFNPSGMYQWQVDDEFTFTGVELDTLNKVIGKFLSSPLDVPTILSIAMVANLIQGKIAQYVEKGVIKEVQPEVMDAE